MTSPTPEQPVDLDAIEKLAAVAYPPKPHPVRPDAAEKLCRYVPALIAELRVFRDPIKVLVDRENLRTYLYGGEKASDRAMASIRLMRALNPSEESNDD